jgi:hypothetical protein
MATFLYRDFLIIATGLFDKDTGVWLPMVDISWWSAAGRGSHTINDPVHSFVAKQEAETFAVEIAKAWVDERLRGTY